MMKSTGIDHWAVQNASFLRFFVFRPVNLYRAEKVLVQKKKNKYKKQKKNFSWIGLREISRYVLVHINSMVVVSVRYISTGHRTTYFPSSDSTEIFGHKNFLGTRQT